MASRYLGMGFDDGMASRSMRFFRIRPEEMVLDSGRFRGRNSGRELLIGGGALLCGGHAELRRGCCSDDGGHVGVGGGEGWARLGE